MPKILAFAFLIAAASPCFAQIQTFREEIGPSDRIAPPTTLLSEMFDSFMAPAIGPDQATVTDYFDQLIDPSHPETSATFKQHYYLNSFYASGPSAPVLYYICGEAPCKPTFVDRYLGEQSRTFDGGTTNLTRYQTRWARWASAAHRA